MIDSYEWVLVKARISWKSHKIFSNIFYKRQNAVVLHGGTFPKEKHTGQIFFNSLMHLACHDSVIWPPTFLSHSSDFTKGFDEWSQIGKLALILFTCNSIYFCIQLRTSQFHWVKVWDKATDFTIWIFESQFCIFLVARHCFAPFCNIQWIEYIFQYQILQLNNQGTFLFRTLFHFVLNLRCKPTLNTI